MGPTDSTKAEPGTIRGDFGTDIERNAVHGSDAPETARVEIAYFFNAMETLALVEALPA
jgi:nucleoside-diphosphate kinase